MTNISSHTVSYTHMKVPNDSLAKPLRDEATTSEMTNIPLRVAGLWIQVRQNSRAVKQHNSE